MPKKTPMNVPTMVAVTTLVSTCLDLLSLSPFLPGGRFVGAINGLAIGVIEGAFTGLALGVIEGAFTGFALGVIEGAINHSDRTYEQISCRYRHQFDLMIQELCAAFLLM